jgi:dCMP deaminase
MNRSKSSSSILTLEEFIDSHDTLLNGAPLPASLPSSTFSQHPQTDFSRVMKLANLSICNNFPSVPALHAYLDQLDLMDEERLRPGWDTYFMVSSALFSLGGSPQILKDALTEREEGLTLINL